jgi:hypothetical protein
MFAVVGDLNQDHSIFLPVKSYSLLVVLYNRAVMPNVSFFPTVKAVLLLFQSNTKVKSVPVVPAWPKLNSLVA